MQISEEITDTSYIIQDKLFPYAKERTKSYLEETWISNETTEIVRELFDLDEFEVYRRDVSKLGEESYDISTVNNFVIYLIDKDLKVGPLKKLQGLVWEKGYGCGDLKGQ